MPVILTCVFLCLHLHWLSPHYITDHLHKVQLFSTGHTHILSPTVACWSCHLRSPTLTTNDIGPLCRCKSLYLWTSRVAEKDKDIHNSWRPLAVRPNLFTGDWRGLSFYLAIFRFREITPHRKSVNRSCWLNVTLSLRSLYMIKDTFRPASSL